MVIIRPYQDSDAEGVGTLIADTHSQFNLAFAPPEERDLFLGPFRHAGSPEAVHRHAIAQVIQAPVVLVAEEDGDVVGVLRGGRQDRGRTVLQSLFVTGARHRQGIGRALVASFEQAYTQYGTTTFRVAASLYAVPFYRALGYKRTTGVRLVTSFQGSGLPVQPMRKIVVTARKDESIVAPRTGAVEAAGQSPKARKFARHGEPE